MKTRLIIVVFVAMAILLETHWAGAQTENEEGGLQLETPALAPPPPTAPGLGPFTNINLGGTLDYRFLILTNGDSPSLGIHVNELFITTNIGDNISILAEQLLLTSDLETVVGQDHGFVYAIFTNLPGLPSDLALKVGRLRFRYGIDSVSDAPANPARDLVYKNLGLISDKGVEVSGFYGDFDYAAAVLMGPDFVTEAVTGTDGEIKSPAENNNRPVALRLGYESSNDLKAGISFFYGKTYPFVNGPTFDMDDMLTNGSLDRSRLVLKRRATLDLRYGFGKWDLSGEVTAGEDEENGATRDVRGYYVRADYGVIPQKVKLLLQYDLWKDGDSATRDDGVITGGLSYNPLDQVTLRLIGFVSDGALSGKENIMDTVIVSQVLLTF
ncbi:MAG: porin [Nitrospirae bacterium]|nr:porin [Nitrospirota bacterium]